MASFGKGSAFFRCGLPGKYLQSLLVLYIVARIPLDVRQKKILYCLMLVGGMVVATYAMPEYLAVNEAAWTFPR